MEHFDVLLKDWYININLWLKQNIVCVMVLGWKEYFLHIYEDNFNYLNTNLIQGYKSFQILHKKIGKIFKG